MRLCVYAIMRWTEYVIVNRLWSFMVAYGRLWSLIKESQQISQYAIFNFNAFMLDTMLDTLEKQG